VTVVMTATSICLSGEEILFSRSRTSLYRLQLPSLFSSLWTPQTEDHSTASTASTSVSVSEASNMAIYSICKSLNFSFPACSLDEQVQLLTIASYCQSLLTAVASVKIAVNTESSHTAELDHALASLHEGQKEKEEKDLDQYYQTVHTRIAREKENSSKRLSRSMETAGSAGGKKMTSLLMRGKFTSVPVKTVAIPLSQGGTVRKEQENCLCIPEEKEELKTPSHQEMAGGNGRKSRE